jgi:hypothetical protein
MPHLRKWFQTLRMFKLNRIVKESDGSDRHRRVCDRELRAARHMQQNLRLEDYGANCRFCPTNNTYVSML